MPIKVVTAQQMRDVEAAAFELGVPASSLMDRAGRSVAEVVATLARERGSSVLVLVGPGNNGGDGLVVARYLTEWGIPAACYLWRRRAEGDIVREEALAAGVPLYSAESDPERETLRQQVHRAGVIVDALLGTGLRRSLDGDVRALLRTVGDVTGNRVVVAVDVPSGLDSDSGAVAEDTLSANITVSLGHLKAGLIVAPGAGYAGRVVLGEIGLPEGLEARGLADVLDDETVARLLPARRPYSHKGTYGKALLVAGSANYVGAAILACRAATRSGAGLVSLATPTSVYHVIAGQVPEVTYFPLPEGDGALDGAATAETLNACQGYDALLLGPGLGRRPGTTAFVRTLVRSVARTEPGHGMPGVVVLDADALNAVASDKSEWWRGLGSRAVVTPHAGEMARLLGRTIEEIERNRLEVASRAARDWGLVVVLKGAHTVVAHPDGRLAVCPVATPSLATAGSGDVLAGTMAGLGAQGLSTWAAAMAATYIHGRAGEVVARRVGEMGSVAGDLLPVVPEVLRSLREARA